MALSLSNFLFAAALLPSLGGLARAATRNYDFNITWVTANPDGAKERPTIGINNQWPIPPITADVGDRVLVNVNNQLGNQSTSLHFHGLYMNGTTEMDGVVGVTQCSIAPGQSFLYNFTVDQPGTYWYHSHERGQYPDGLRGPLIVNDPKSPFKDDYDEEVVLTFSDWYHDQMPPLLKWFISYANPTGAEPVPDAALVNDTQNLTVSVEPGKTYFFRMINIGAFAGQYIWFEGHTMKVIEVDGIYTEPYETDMIYMGAAQRYGVLISMKNSTDANFPFVMSMDETLFDTVPDTLNPNATGWLVYDSKKDMPQAALLDDFAPLDDSLLVPHDHEKIFDHVDYSFNLDLTMDNLGDGANYAFFNGITYVPPKVPTLYSVLTTGPNATNPAIYGRNSHAFVLEKGQVVEIVLNNDDTGKHPFHLHGHAFQVAYRSTENVGNYNGSVPLIQTPMRRDTLVIIWLFHCHIEWHVASGLIATMIEAPLDIQKTISIPPEHYDTCKAKNIPTAGNAAGNTKNFLDLSGENISVKPLPAGFTARGIVALVFSCISAFLGLAAITWYGFGDLGKNELAAAQRRIREGGISLQDDNH
ncbi:multicopper oxidase [Xylona heveae TC161]|uniref:Multicopper oxidase n=1 Tax=Xylona heveae (strain CBS 132557 / TC161) TaxID=1328760 RepID=A0A165HUC4_XYLHT|nr:multicopper oxidase [Xylona heveae TC161]KZF23935.1 multicopper oxidase [Xylona heveae TC161]